MIDSHVDSGLPNRAEPEIQLFAYPEMPWTGDLHGWSQAFGRETLNATQPASGNGIVEEAQSGQAAELLGQQRAELDAQWLARLTEEVRQAGEKGRREGFELGLQRGREESSRLMREEQDRLHQQGAALAASFADERTLYFHQAEEELVRLALAIAARILRREAQMDPLLLTGAVRVALGQLAQSTSVRLHVPEADRPLWEEAFARLPNLAHRPEVVGEPEMELGACRVETELGSADLSLWTQLKEIERGFFDRVGARGITEDPEAAELPTPIRSSATRSAASSPPHSASPASAASPTASHDAAASGPVAPTSQFSHPIASAASTGTADEAALASALYGGREW